MVQIKISTSRQVEEIKIFSNKEEIKKKDFYNIEIDFQILLENSNSKHWFHQELLEGMGLLISIFNQIIYNSDRKSK